MTSRMSRWKRPAGLIAIAVLGACASRGTSTRTPAESVGAHSGNPAAVVEGVEYAPELDPSDFTTKVDNPYFPLEPGAKWTYEGKTDEGLETTVVEVTKDEKKVALGIDAVVVRDTVRLEGVIIEDTFDWFAQDSDGNVWYLGEDTYEYENGKPVNSEGAWEAGVDGAMPGIVMPGDPKIGEPYRQEYYKGEAEDTGEVIKLGQTTKTKYATFDDVLVTEDLNPMEPGIVENKHFAKGVGLIFEEKVRGSDEKAELIDLIQPGND